MASTSTITLYYLQFLLILLVFCSFNHLLSFGFTSLEYYDALEKSILFFEGQQSGRLPSNQKLTWRGDSGLSDGSSNHVNLVGGYYDASYNLKFGLPMAFTITLLAWSAIEFGSSMQDQIENAREAIRWSTDYLLKAVTTTPDMLYVQLSKPSMEHGCWERPEDMVAETETQNHGSDVAAETEAALAASSLVFRDSDPTNSPKLLLAAIDTIIEALTMTLNFVVCPFHCSYSGYNDELIWGTSWIYKAPGINSYMEFIQSNGHMLGADDDGYTFSWDDRRPGTKILLSKEFLEKNSEEFQLYI